MIRRRRIVIEWTVADVDAMENDPNLDVGGESGWDFSKFMQRSDITDIVTWVEDAPAQTGVLQSGNT